MTEQGERDERDEAKVRQKYELLIEPMRQDARRLGYALAVHGSLARDIDLVAIPWTGEAVSARALAETLGRTIERINGVAYRKENEDTEYFLRGTPGAKPHGRLGWVWHLGGTYIDLAVMPRTDPPNMSGAAVVAANDGVFYIGVNDETGKMEQVEFFRDKLKQKEIIPVVPQSALTSERTAREQAELRLVAAHLAIGSALKWIETHAPDPGIETVLRRAVSESGSEVADELRRLRELRQAVLDWDVMPEQEFSAKYRPEPKTGGLFVLVDFAKASQPPPQPERSE